MRRSAARCRPARNDFTSSVKLFIPVESVPSRLCFGRDSLIHITRCQTRNRARREFGGRDAPPMPSLSPVGHTAGPSPRRQEGMRLSFSGRVTHAGLPSHSEPAQALLKGPVAMVEHGWTALADQGNRARTSSPTAKFAGHFQSWAATRADVGAPCTIVNDEPPTTEQLGAAGPHLVLTRGG